MSNALTPSFGCESVLEGGCVVSSIFLAICFAIVLETNLLITSPTTIPLTPPSGLLNAVIRPKRMVSMISSGTFPTASSELTWTNKSDSTSLSRTSHRWFIPDGPGATPRLAFLKQMRSSNGSNSNGLRGSNRRISDSIPVVKQVGLLLGSVRIPNVARLPGARDAPSKA